MFLGDIVALRISAAKEAKAATKNLCCSDTHVSDQNNEQQRGDAACFYKDSSASSTPGMGKASPDESVESQTRPRSANENERKKTGASQVVGVMVLEFGVILRKSSTGPAHSLSLSPSLLKY